MQIAPVVPGTHSFMSAQVSIKFSPLWTSGIKHFALTKNYRQHNDPSYASAVRKIGRGESTFKKNDIATSLSPHMHTAIITKIPTQVTYSEETAISHAYPNLDKHGNQQNVE